MSVVVFGGSGFLGTRLCRRLERRGRAFSIVDRAPSARFPQRSVLADVGSQAALGAGLAAGDAIVNLIAEHRDNVMPPERYDAVNVGGARNVCAAARTAGVAKIVFASSVAVYGEGAARNAGEGVPARPTTRYGSSKLAAEAVYRDWQAEAPAERTLAIVRPTAVFGEGGGGNANLLFERLAASRFVMVGDGRNVKSLAYVENVAAFLEHALSFPPGVHLYNYVDKPDLTMNELVSLVRARLGKGNRVGARIPYPAAHLAGQAADCIAVLTRRELPISALRVRKFCADSQFGCAAARTGFAPPATLIEGLEATLDDILRARGASRARDTSRARDAAS